MERLAEAERVLKYGAIPEDEEGLLAFRKQHKVSITWYFTTPYTDIYPFLSGTGEVKGQGLLQNNKLVLIKI